MKKKIAAGVLSMSMLSAPYAVLAEAPFQWHNVNVYETSYQEQNESLFNSENYNFVKYSQLEAKLKEVTQNSNRVTIEKRGISSDGHDMFVVTVSDPQAKGKFGKYQAIRKQMLKNPAKAQDFVDKHPDLKIPVMINGSIHGTEFTGTDSILHLIERFANDHDDVTKQILQDHIIVFNVTANPDGRINATRFNSNGIDLNRDFITRSQPETKQMVDLITEWNPMVFLDLHGYVKQRGGTKQGLIEPCTPPHNPNYQYDLFTKWAMNQAEAMEAEIIANKDTYKNTNTAVSRVDYHKMTSVEIPFRDSSDGWDDYPPIFTPMYAMYHGAYGYTLETPTNDWDGVQWMYDAVMGALKYSSENKVDMVKDQMEMFKRGINFDHPFHKEGFFPKAYILPVDQQDPTATKKAVEHLMANDIVVSEAQKEFSFNGKTYPKGTYLVEMDQAKAGLANTMLWDGEDISSDIPSMYDISAWSLPELWGFEAVEVPAKSHFSVHTSEVKHVDNDGELIGKGPYVVPNSSVKAVQLANSLIQNGFTVKRSSSGHFHIDSGTAPALKKLVKESGLKVETAKVPEDSTLLTNLKVTILRDGGISKGQSHAGTKLALERLGFNVSEKTPQDVAINGLGDTDVFVYSGSQSLISVLTGANKEFGLESSAQAAQFKEKVQAFVNNGGKYIAVGAGASIATKTLGLASVGVNTGGSDSNGIVMVDYQPSPLTTGYRSTDYGFVYRPAWYTNTADYTVAATYKNSDDFFVAGHWKNRTGAEGQPVIVKDNHKDVTLIGLEAGFRDHTDYLFRLISNAIYSK
ncbi:M14 family zinc carboxypeptidase [Bacillus sp. FJAT-27231]|uniref:M14 family zinc carboxypeptidase n=1 Tax=Bacillus sp. FJAT-27231 TaxID=1679168 RepID=UPI000A6FE446|nr:M14 family zinc carboxypeptidase [Bacillus sp. FJAT-27231]